MGAASRDGRCVGGGLRGERGAALSHEAWTCVDVLYVAPQGAYGICEWMPPIECGYVTVVNLPYIPPKHDSLMTRHPTVTLRYSCLCM